MDREVRRFVPFRRRPELNLVLRHVFDEVGHARAVRGPGRIQKTRRSARAKRSGQSGQLIEETSGRDRVLE